MICSVIIQEQDLLEAYQLAETVRSRHFQTGEIKSSKLRARDSDRRSRILGDLTELPLKLYFIVVEKDRVYKDGGLRFKQSFIKSVNNLLYERLFNHCPNLNMTVDAHGGPEFQSSLREYVAARYADDLFGDSAFQTISSKDNVLIQIADFFAGTLAHIYEEKASNEVIQAYKNILRTKTLGLLEWPPKYQALLPPPMSPSAYADYRVHQQALRQADAFVAKLGKHPDEDERLQLCILNYLRFRSEFVSDEYVSTDEIAKHLTDKGFPSLGDQKIRSSGIAKLRDAEVIIASATKGYKIPRTRADINDFLELASSQIVPLLDRVKKARDVYRLSSGGEYDILADDQFAEIRKLLSSLDAL